MNKLDIYNSDASISLSLNENGINELNELIASHANFDLPDFVTTGYASYTASAKKQNFYNSFIGDAGFDDEGEMHLELCSHDTKSGNPVTYSLSIFDHFDCELK